MAVVQGRGNAFAAMAIGLLLALQCCSWHASATTWTVGGSQGWNLGVNYTIWASGKAFRTDDTLFFPYTQGYHDVVVVHKTGYDNCSSTKQLRNYTAGNTNVTLNATGKHYYLCSFPSHCSDGMRLAVTVTAARGPSPAPTPSPNFGPSPAPTPSPNFGRSPAPTPPSSSLTAPFLPPNAALATLLGLAATVLAL